MRDWRSSLLGWSSSAHTVIRRSADYVHMYINYILMTEDEFWKNSAVSRLC